MTLLESALAYEKLGWSVFPLRPRDKTPLVKWQSYQKRHATKAELTEWFKKWPDANIGLATGAVSGVVVIDIDSQEGQEAYIAEFGELHNTIRQTTGKPGALHLLFKPRNGFKYHNMVRTITAVDVRGDGGYIVLAPSIHPNGTRYSWNGIDPLENGLNDLLDIPQDVHDLLTRANVDQEGKAKKNPEDWVNELMLSGAEKGARNATATKLAGYFLRLHSEDVDQVDPILENWNKLRCTPPLTWKELRVIIRSVASTRKRAQAEQFSEQLQSLTQITYPDGTIKYQVHIKGYEGYIEMDYATLDSNAKFRIAVNPVLGVATPPIKRDLWLKYVNNLLATRKNIAVTIDETPTGLVLDVIKKTTPKTDLETYFRRNMVVQNETLFFQLPTFLEILQSYNIKSIDNKKLGKILRDLGFKSEPRTIKNASVRLWMIKSTTWPEKAGPWPFAYYKTEDSQ